MLLLKSTGKRLFGTFDNIPHLYRNEIQDLDLVSSFESTTHHLQFSTFHQTMYTLDEEIL